VKRSKSEGVLSGTWMEKKKTTHAFDATNRSLKDGGETTVFVHGFGQKTEGSLEIGGDERVSGGGSLFVGFLFAFGFLGGLFWCIVNCFFGWDDRL